MTTVNIGTALISGAITLWLVNSYFHPAYKLRSMLNAVVINAVSIWILQAVGFWGRLVGSKVSQ